MNTVWIFGIGLWLNEADRRVSATRQQAEAMSRAAAAEERLRVARDLHDVLGQSLSMMVVQAEVADELVDTDPQGARRAMEHVQETGRAALREIREVLGILRAEGEMTDGMDQLPELVTRFRSAGLPVTLEGAERVRLRSPADQVVYRVVQEALTNALRHAGPEATRVVLSTAAGELHVRVENEPGRVRHAAGPGESIGAHGLVGMRERIEALGGRLTAAPREEGGFAVDATVPDVVMST